MHKAPIVESGDTSTRCPADGHRRSDGQRIAPAEPLDETGNRRQKRRQHHAGRAAVDRDQSRHERDVPGDGVLVANRASREVKRSRPCVFSSSAISTVTPLTMMMTAHGIFSKGLSLIGQVQHDEQRRARKRPHADVHLEEDDADDQRRDHAERDPVARNRSGVASAASSRPARCTWYRNSRHRPARNSPRWRPPCAPAGCSGRRSRSWPARPMPDHDAVDDDAGRRKRRQRPRAGAVADHDRHEERRHAARPATAIAIGATSAALAILPGPSEDRPLVRKKNMMGSSPTFPRQSFMARWATLSSVPFSCACVNSSVTPASVRNRADGNPAKTSSMRKPGEVHADDPGEDNRQDAHVQRAETADHNRGHQRRSPTATRHSFVTWGRRARYRPRSSPLTRSNTRSGGGSPFAAFSAASLS